MAKKAAKKTRGPRNTNPFIRLSKPQFDVFKADLIAEQDGGKAPKTREPVIEQILANKRVKGAELDVSRNSVSAVKAMLAAAKKLKSEASIRLYTRILENLEAAA